MHDNTFPGRATTQWLVRPVGLPAIRRRCRTCPSTEYRTQGRFRVNANHKLLDVWLLALCVQCGQTVKLTIDAGLQDYAARRMGDQSGALVAMDVESGDILAFVSMPAFDPNSFSSGIGRTEWRMLSEDDHHPLLNKVTQGLLQAD